jgi:hypothetical protein
VPDSRAWGRRQGKSTPAVINIGARIPIGSAIGLSGHFFLSQGRPTNRNIYGTDKA